MSLNGILSSALTALQTNTAALRVVSNNVANMNTPGYARRVVNQQVLVAGGQLQGVNIADIQRVTDQFLTRETLSANSGAQQYSTQATIFDQLNGMLGKPGDGTALTTQLDNIYAALGSAALAPNASASQQGILNSFQSLASTISNLSTSISGLQQQVDQQVGTSIGTVNSLIQQIYSLNQQIQNATAAGDTSTGLLDQRDTAIQNLSSLIDVRTATQQNGGVVVMTGDGVNLVGDTYAQLSYQPGSSNGTYGPIAISNINPSTGAVVGQSQTLDPHLTSGSIKGLIDMRDGTLSELQQELGNFAQNTALAFNEQANANTAVPPPAVMQGRNTSLLSTDALNFTGKTTIAVADSTGKLVSRIDVDFDTGTLSVDGAGSVGIGSTVGSFVSALNTALGGNGSAVFSNGVLTLSATGGNGIIVQDDATTPSSRAGAGFSNFFGLNDIFRTGAPANTATGLSASDAGGFTGGSMTFTLKDSNGNIAKQAVVNVTAGMTIGNIISAINTAFGGAATASLGSDGSFSITPASQYAGYRLDVNNDTTQRGTTGMSFTTMFGIGSLQKGALATSFSVNPALVTQPSLMPFAQSNITSASVAGDIIAGPGDNRGLLALQNIQSQDQSFARVGNLGAQVATLGDYAASFYQDTATRSQAVTANATAQGDRLAEAQTRQSQNSGVNLDEELTKMMTYQQAYAAGARMLTVVGQLYDTLLQIQ
ncbi:MAG TPA: flagellar hook-associated protein FlgK [Rhizomicrobium sp.]|nr:flagellar hook-associated protein FlgK [Rhizomicrobium sp.]